MIARKIENDILKDFNKKKIICLIGARQVGKTTLLDTLANLSEKILRLNCDDYLDASQIENKSIPELKNLLKDYEMIQIDEVQRIENVGLALKNS